MRLLAGRDGPAGRDFVPDNVNCHDLAAVAVALFGEGVCSVRPIRRARVHCTNAASADRFAAEMSQHLGIIVERADTPARNLEDADVICTATPSSTPVFADNEVPPGAHINAVGAYRPGMVEIPTATIRRPSLWWIFTPYSRAWRSLEKADAAKTPARISMPPDIASLPLPTLARICG